jgi:hypothetical protein
MKDPIEALITTPWAFLVGILISQLLGCLVGSLIRYVSSEIDENPQDDLSKEEWVSIISPVGKRGGFWIGILERFFFYGAIILSSPELVFGWLAFKVASKWEVWQNIVKVPSDEKKTSKLSVTGRRAWGDRVLQRFLIGTLGNAMSGFLGALTTIILYRLC